MKARPASDNIFTSLPAALVVGLAVALVVLVLRFAGVLEPLELAAYDALVRARPNESPDERVVVVRITEADLQQYRYPLPDDVLARLLARVETYKPRLVGLDIYRDQPTGALADRLKSDSRLVGVARINSTGDGFETPPSPGMRPEDGRVGFSDVPLDNDRVVRQGFLYTALGPSGQQVYAFPLLLALRYLDAENIAPAQTATGELQLGKVVLPRLNASAGSYHNHPDFEKSYRVLSSYRLPRPAREVDMAEVLAGRVDPALLQDRIVLIGYTADSVNDVFYVPYGVRQEAVVVVHAQLVSQFLAAGLDGRTLPWYWPDPLEWLWVLGVALAAAVIAWRLGTPVAAFATVAGMVLLVGGTGYVLALQQGWVPVVPAALTAVLAPLAIVALPKPRPAPAPATPAEAPARPANPGDSRAGTVIATAAGEQLSQPRNPFARPNWIGQEIGNGRRYQITRQLGSGGMGEVYLAVDRTLGRDVALKILRANVNADAFNLEKRFEKEAKVCAALESNNIVQVSDYGLTVEGYPFYVMEYLQGESLGQVLKREGSIPIPRAIAIVRQVCDGLRHAHAGVQLAVGSGATRELVRVVHRDLKPDNIFLVPTAIGELVKILDFGIAKTVAESDPAGGDRTDLTMGGFVGTSRYAAPEQWRGERNLDHRADIYSLGIIFYEMLSGNNPFGIEPEEAYTAPALWYEGHVLREPTPLREQPGCAEVPPALEQVVMRCLQKTPTGRFANVDELIDALAQAIAPTP